MADIKNITIDGTTYDLKDDKARNAITDLKEDINYTQYGNVQWTDVLARNGSVIIHPDYINYSVDSTTGKINTYNTKRICNRSLIFIPEGATLSLVRTGEMANPVVCFFDEQQAFIGSGTMSNIPSTARWIRIMSLRNDSADVTSVYADSNMIFTLTRNNSIADLIINDKTIKETIGNISISSLFDVGRIRFADNTWTWAEDNESVRTKAGISLHIAEGVTVGLSDYTDAKFYIGWVDGSNVKHWEGWKTADFVTPIEADYIIQITNKVAKNQTSAVALGSLFFGYQAVAFESIEINKSNISELENLELVLNDGYWANSGYISPSTDDEVYSRLLPTKNGQKYYISLANGEVADTWIAYALFDDKKRFISRTVVYGVQNVVDYNGEIIVNNSSAKYISFTWRNHASTTIKILTNAVHINTLYGYALEDNERLFKSAINPNVRSINHRGFNTIAPENTLPAFVLSRKMGFEYVETDVAFTSDGVAVLLHDATINRTARNSDGTELDSDVNISDITYSEALTYDFGIWKGAEYAETKIPTFTQFMTLCRNIGVMPYVEIKSTGDYTEAMVQGLIDIAKACGMKGRVTWISFNDTFLSYIKNYAPSERLGLVCNSVNADVISDALALKTSTNEVFVDSGTRTQEDVDYCLEADLPMEVWTVDSISALESYPPYITGVTSNEIVGGYELYLSNI